MVSMRNFFGLFLLCLTTPQVSARVRCFSIFDCETKVREGSECINGFCTNPYTRWGCLPNRLKDQYKIRTCSSEDSQSSIEQGYCTPTALDYMEVRVASQNWESVFFISWILQILLGELLDVPVSIETGTNDTNVDFYNIDLAFQYGLGNDWSAIRTAQKVKDCRKVRNNKEYTSCAHLVPEVWAGTGHLSSLEALQAEQAIEAPSGLGELGAQYWFMRRKTAREYPELTTYLAMQGPEGRLKLASIFKRPVDWGDYCKSISADGCKTADEYAERAPLSGEQDIYHQEGGFHGYFMATDKNNCTLNPNTCTGHIVDYPCGWTSYVSQQAYYLGIAVESNGKEPGSNGYTYGQMTQIWTAADQLNEDVLMQWWHPESLYQTFLGSESEFTIVSLPPPTQACVENRVSTEDRCSTDPKVRVGDALGSCAEPPQALAKVVSTTLYEISYDPKKPSALASPAYDAISDFQITDLQVGEIFDYWFAKNNDKFGLDPRDAVCDWVVENLDQLVGYIPKGHPRIIEENNQVYKEPLFDVALAFACLAMTLSLVAFGVTYLLREKEGVRYAQVEFLYLLLLGLLLVSSGALMTSLPPTDAVCVAIGWVTNIGYTFEFVPLIVKIAAINRIMTAYEQMRRVELKMVTLFGAVALVCGLVGAVLLVWTIVDPATSKIEDKLNGEQSESGQYIVLRTSYCSSGQEFWNYIGVSWQLLLLLVASVLAFQTRKLQDKLNETKVLAMMIYSHFVFVVILAITFLLENSLDHSDLSASRSIIYSLDTIASLLIYFLPKFLQKEGGPAGTQTRSGSKSNADNSNQVHNEPRNIHTWKSRNNPNSSTAGQAPEAAIGSVRESSIEYKTQGEIEEEEDSRLDQISEEEGSHQSVHDEELEEDAC